MKVELVVQIKELKTKTLVSNDKSTRIVLEQDNLATPILNNLSGLVNTKRNESKELRMMISDE